MVGTSMFKVVIVVEIFFGSCEKVLVAVYR